MHRAHHPDHGGGHHHGAATHAVRTRQALGPHPPLCFLDVSWPAGEAETGRATVSEKAMQRHLSSWGNSWCVQQRQILNVFHFTMENMAKQRHRRVGRGIGVFQILAQTQTSILNMCKQSAHCHCLFCARCSDLQGATLLFRALLMMLSMLPAHDICERCS